MIDRRHPIWLAVAATTTLVSICPGPMRASDPGPAASAADGNEIKPDAEKTPLESDETWNWHIQNTDTLQGHPGFFARYSGAQSLSNRGDWKQTESLDLFFGLKLWKGAEFHADGLMWQGFGLSHTFGVAGFPSGEAFKAGTEVPNVTFAHLFVQQSIGLGGGTEDIPDGQLQLASRQDVSRLTLSAGKLNAKDYFDTNAYANDPHTQFLNWSLMANGAWDYPADSLGYMPGFVMDLHEQTWSARYGVFQVPRVANGLASDPHVLQAWGMATEFEHRHEIGEHPGAVRFLAFLNRATMGSYSATLDDPSLGADIKLTERYRYKFGFGLNAEQELSKTVGMFFRLGWNDGKTESWAFTDVDRSLSLGARIKGDRWGRAEDAFGIAGIVNAISSGHSALLAAGGMGILVGDGRLTYDTERILEAYYDIHIWKSVHTAVDYQFIENPGYNRDRGPVSVIAARLHWEF